MTCTRADEMSMSESILYSILDHITSSEMIIADITGLNANVFYELGIAHCVSKNVIIITQDIKRVPFDLKDMYCFEYDLSSNDGFSKLQSRIVKAAKEIKSRSIPSMLEGAKSRTVQLADYMDNLLNSGKDLSKVMIRIQAGFTSLTNLDFSSKTNPDLISYGELLIKERNLLIELIDRGASLSAIIFPPIGPWTDKKGNRWKIRYEKLLEFLKQKDDRINRCDFVVSIEEGSNLFFFGDDILFEGYKTGIEHGYGWTMVYNDAEYVSTRIRVFDMLFNSARSFTLDRFSSPCKGCDEKKRLRIAVINAVEKLRDGEFRHKFHTDYLDGN